MNESLQYRRAPASIPQMPLPGEIVAACPSGRLVPPFGVREGLLVGNLVAPAPEVVRRPQPRAAKDPSRKLPGGNGRGGRFGPGSGRIAAELASPPRVDHKTDAPDSLCKRVRRVCACLGGDENAVALVAAILVLLVGVACLAVVGKRQLDNPQITRRSVERHENAGTAPVAQTSPPEGFVFPAKTRDEPVRPDSGSLAGVKTTGPF